MLTVLIGTKSVVGFSATCVDGFTLGEGGAKVFVEIEGIGNADYVFESSLSKDASLLSSIYDGALCFVSSSTL